MTPRYINKTDVYVRGGGEGKSAPDCHMSNFQTTLYCNSTRCSGNGKEPRREWGARLLN